VSDLKIAFGSQFKRDIKKQFLVLATAEWAEVLHSLTKRITLPEKYLDHPLAGNWIGFRECHIQPDILLIYDNSGEKLILVRLGPPPCGVFLSPPAGGGGFFFAPCENFVLFKNNGI